MNPTKSKVVTRFAPSPTGFMHVGGVRTALYAYLLARKEGGTFILRIEDTDKKREVAGSIDHIQESLRWLGIDWDYGPGKPGPFGSTIQSERLESYQAFARQLLEKGFAYPDPYTPEEVAAFRAESEKNKKPFLFRDYRPKTFEVWDGKKPLRFKSPIVKRYHWHDAVRGPLEAGEEALDDFILIKGDGYPTYNFAHIIDDHLMGVTHILRADEFISSTPNFLSLYDALGIKAPILATLPPILRDDRTKKLGKRDGAKDILEYRAEGYLPDAMINYLALIGWNPGTEQEIFTKGELIQSFSLDRVHKAGGAFNEDKLKWVNKEHIKRMPIEAQIDVTKEILCDTPINKALLTPSILERLTPIIIDRIEVFGDIKKLVSDGELEYFFSRPTIDQSKLLWKGQGTIDEVKKHLSEITALLSPVTDWSIEGIKAAVWPYAEAHGRGSVLWPMRVALSGKDKSPDPFTLAYVIGKEETLKRLAI